MVGKTPCWTCLCSIHIQLKLLHKPRPVLLLAMRCDAHCHNSLHFPREALFLHPSLPKAGKYTLLLETYPQQRMDLWDSGENSRQGFRGSWAQSCCNHQRINEHLSFNLSTKMSRASQNFQRKSPRIQEN